MNRIERKVLAACIKTLRAHNSYLWWELKRQIWEGGYQTYYPRQDEYRELARQLLERIDYAEFALLESEWKKSNADRESARNEIVDHYVAVIIEELVRRATTAAYRTIEW